MIKLGLQDLSFYSDKSSSRYHKSKNIIWDRSGEAKDLVVFTDLCLSMSRIKQYKNSKKVAWLIEPYVISPNSYNYIEKNYKDFNLVLSHDKKFLEKIPNGQIYHPYQSWVAESDFKLYPKTKNICMIGSKKRWTEGHDLRFKLAERCKDVIDLYGPGYGSWIDHKVSVLKDYRYCIAIENCISDEYVTEKAIDPILCGCCVIYCGMPSIKEIFPYPSIMPTNSLEGLEGIIRDVATEDYYNLDQIQDAIKKNFEIAKTKIVAEDYFIDIFKNKGLL